MAKWRWECQTCQKAKGCCGSGLCFPCLDDECKYEAFQNFATTSTKYDPSKLVYYTSNSAERRKMTEREKIANILNSAEISQELSKEDIYKFADALIEAGIGDVSELKNHRLIAEYLLIPEDDNTYALPNTPIRVKQLYSGEEVEQIVKERDEYKHRAEVAEMTLKFVCRTQENLNILVDGKPWTKEEIYNRYIEQAKKELTEEKKDD